ISFKSSSGESSTPCSFSLGDPAAETTPPLMMELPPGVRIFSKTTTDAPAFLASYAAASAAKPLPTTTTSKVSSHFFGMAAASAVHGFNATPLAAMPATAAAPPAVFKKLRLLRDFTFFFSSTINDLLFCFRLLLTDIFFSSLSELALNPYLKRLETLVWQWFDM